MPSLSKRFVGKLPKFMVFDHGTLAQADAIMGLSNLRLPRPPLARGGGARVRQVVGGADDFAADEAAFGALLQRHCACGGVGGGVPTTGGGLAEYYSKGETRAPVWLCVGDAEKAAALVGLSAAERAGGQADMDVVARWLDDGMAPNGASGRGYSARSTHGFDLTFSAPKSVSLLRALGEDQVLSKAVVDAHNIAVREAMEYLHSHAGYTRVHNPQTGRKDLVRLPGFVAAAYQHETSRAGDPHLHTHVLLPNRQARSDGALVSYDSKSLHHEAKAAGIIYQATLRRELHQSVGLEWVRSTRIPGWLRLLAWLATPSARGRSARRNCASGPTTISSSTRRLASRRRSWRVRRKPLARPSPARATRSFQQPKQPTLLTCADRATGLGDLAGNAQAVSFASSRSLDR